jgi:hypothetical protein
MQQHRDFGHKLDDVGEIAGMEGMTIIHAGAVKAAFDVSSGACPLNHFCVKMASRRGF